MLVNVAGKGHEEEFEDTKEVIRIFISKRNRQHYAYGQKKKYKIKGQNRFTKDTHKTKDRVTRTSLKTEDGLRCSNPVISHE